MKRFIIAALAATTLGSAITAVTAQAADDIRPRMIRFGYGLNEDSNQGRAAKVLAEMSGRVDLVVVGSEGDLPLGAPRGSLSRDRRDVLQLG